MIGPQELAARLLATRVGRPLGTLAYEAVLQAASAALADVDGVRGVYVTGSFARRDPGFMPGRSDLDIVLTLEPGWLDAEIATRDAIDRRLRVLRASTLIVQTLDVIEGPDLPLLQRHSDAWSFELACRWRHVRGVDDVIPMAVRAQLERRILFLAKLLRRWFKASAALLAIPETETSESNARAAERLLAECLGVVVDATHGTSLEERIARASAVPALARAVEEFRASPGAVSPGARLRRALVCSLVALDHYAAELTRAWEPSHGEARGTFEAPNDAALGAFTREALAAGFDSVVVMARDAGARSCVVATVAPTGMSAERVVARAAAITTPMATLAGATGAWVQRPVFLTARMAQAAYLFDAAPFAFDSLHHAGSLLGGVPLGLRQPSEEERAVVQRCQMVMQLIRPRSRRFHSADPKVAFAALEREVRGVVTPLRERGVAGSVVFEARVGSRGPGGGDGERQLLEELREELGWVRERLGAFSP